MLFRRFLLSIILLLFHWVTSAQSYVDGKRPFVTQLHIHGWSNHNGAEKPGSIQFHNWQSDSVNVDVLWWTEHYTTFLQQTYFFPLIGATVDPVDFHIQSVMGSSGGDYHGWNCIRKEGNYQALINGDSLQLILESNSTNQDWQMFSYAPSSILGTIRELQFTKPMAAVPVLNLNMSAGFSDASNTSIQFVFKLAWHFRQTMSQDVILFDLSPLATQSSVSWNGNDSVFVTIPLTSGMQNLNLDLSDAIAFLDLGIDNTISEIELRLLARQGAILEATFSQIHLTAAQNNADSILQKEREILDHYSTIGETHNILGVEYNNTEHLNAFIPKTISDPQVFTGELSNSIDEWVAMVHQNGGLVSFNHMFGTNWAGGSDSLQDYRTDTLARFLYNQNIFGADILEVGYINRGGADFSRHLKVWDVLTANGRFVYGNGVSDSHGDLWMHNNFRFHTWIYAKDSSDTELLSALSKGKMCFGIHNRFKGDLWYTLENLELGDRGFINKFYAKPNILLTGAPAGSTVRLTQVLLEESFDLKYLYKDYQVNLNDLPVLDFTQPCFVRFGVYDANGQPLIFGQPIVVLGVVEDTSVVDSIKENSLFIFPNPASQIIRMEFHVSKPGVYAVRLLDAHSKQVAVIEKRYFYEGKYGLSQSCAQYASGLYYVEISGQNESLTSKVFLK